MRPAPEALARGLIVALMACAVAAACARPDAGADVRVAWTIEPAPPSTGAATVAELTLKDEQQQPIRGARLQLEAHMSHPGMSPVTTPLAETGNGVYAGRLQFSMAGDWLLVVSGQLADGTRFTRQLEVPGVQPAG